MKITRIKKRYGENRNLGNYESMRVEVELEAQLEDGDDVRESSDKLLHGAKQLVRRDISHSLQDDK